MVTKLLLKDFYYMLCVVNCLHSVIYVSAVMQCDWKIRGNEKKQTEVLTTSAMASNITGEISTALYDVSSNSFISSDTNQTDRGMETFSTAFIHKSEKITGQTHLYSSLSDFEFSMESTPATNAVLNTSLADYESSYITTRSYTADSTGVFRTNNYWDAAHVSAMDYVHSYCPRRCLESEVVLITDIETRCPDYFCFHCDCQRPRCEKYGLCCPDISEPFVAPTDLESNFTGFFSSPAPVGDFKNSTDYHQIEEDGPVVRCDSQSSDEVNFLYIASCLSGYRVNPDAREKCETTTLLGNVFDLRAFTRVADTVDNVVYRNVYCAICNGINETIPFKLTIECIDFMAIYSAGSQEEVIQLALGNNSGCRVEQLIPGDVSLAECEPEFFSNDVIENCTANDQLWKYDENVKWACEEVVGLTNRVYSPFTSQLYRNVFCSICHTGKYPGHSHGCHCEDVPKIASTPAPFTLLLRFVGEDDTGYSPSPNCGENQWLSPNDKCLPLNCDAGKLLKNHSCHSVFTEISGLVYRLQLWFVPTQIYAPVSDSFSDELFTSIEQELSQSIALNSSITELNIGMVKEKPDTRNSSSVVYWVKSTLIALPNVSRDIWEDGLITRILRNVITIAWDQTNITLTPLVMFPPTYDADVVCSGQQELFFCRNTSVINHNDSTSQNGSRYVPVKVSSFLTCPFVTFGKDQYDVTANLNAIPPTLSVTIQFDVATVKIIKSIEMSMIRVTEEGGLDVCQDLLLEKLQDFKRSDANAILELVTLVSLLTSMCCLIITFLTYSCVSSLRNMAGVHNMFLSGSLFCAQGLILASNKLSPPSLICTIIGVVTHFFWLFKFASTSACCLHMFRVFTAKTRRNISSRRERRTTILKCAAFTTFAPACIVLGVITWHLVTSGMQTIGYGARRCYLDSFTFVGITLAGPALLIASCNILMFALTVAAIRKVQQLKNRVQSNKDHHNNLYVYAKLSSMTGAFWALSILAENLNLDFLRMIAVSINGLQGVFIFFSYICNKRVLKACVPRLSRPYDVTKKSSPSTLPPS